jgi:hypothetical protein
MNDSVSYVRLAVVAIVAITIWFLSTLVPSPYMKDTALVPIDSVRQASRPEPLSDARVPTATPRLAGFDTPLLPPAG